MRIENVNEAIETNKIVTLNLQGLTLHYKIRGVISRYDNQKKSWYYLLELQDIKASNSITVAKIEDVKLI